MVSSVIKYENKSVKISTLYENDILYNKSFKNGVFYEQNLLNEIKKYNLNGIYIDLGANVGNHSLFFGLFCPSTKVISVEAEPMIANVLEKNLSDNLPKDKYDIIIKAVSDFKGYVNMSQLVKKNIGGTSIEIKGEGNIECDTINNLFGNLKNVVVLKMDIEGEEVNAIKESDIFFKNNSPIIISELKTKEDFDKFKNIISKYGYITNGINYAISPTYIWVKKM